jgi:hypothetical protein
LFGWKKNPSGYRPLWQTPATMSHSSGDDAPLSKVTHGPTEGVIRKLGMTTQDFGCVSWRSAARAALQLIPFAEAISTLELILCPQVMPFRLLIPSLHVTSTCRLIHSPRLFNGRLDLSLLAHCL